MNSDEGTRGADTQATGGPPQESTSQPEHRGDGKEDGKQQARARENHAPRRSVFEWLRRWDQWTRDDVEVFFSGVVAATAFLGMFGLIVTSCLTLKSLEETRVSTRATVEAAKAATRQADLAAAQLSAAGADFVIEAVQMTDPLPLQPNARLRMECRMRNAGDTPARAVKATWRLHFSDTPMPPPDRNGRAASVALVGSEQALNCPDAPSVWLNGRENGRTLTPEEATRLAANDPLFRLYLQVFVYYTTVFGQPKLTQFCGYVENAAITLCPTNNSTEELPPD